MCGLCGLFGVAEHWTDRAGADTGGPASTYAERRQRARAASEMLDMFGLTLREWSRRYVLAGRTGRSMVIDNLGAVWPAAEQIAGRECDPLDDAVIDAMAARRAGR